MAAGANPLAGANVDITKPFISVTENKLERSSFHVSLIVVSKDEA